MNFDLHIENIGKLTDAKIRIGRFTVFAGPNNTGKSFVSKFLYSIFDAMNADPVVLFMENFIGPTLVRLNNFEETSELLSSLRMETEKLCHRVVSADGVEELNDIIPTCAEQVKEIKKRLSGIRLSIEELTEENFNPEEYDHEDFLMQLQMNNDFVENLEKILDQLEKFFRYNDARNLVSFGLVHEIHKNLIENFQVEKLADLQKTKNSPSMVKINNFGEFKFVNEEQSFSGSKALLPELQKLSNVIYLESSVYWKLKNALENVHLNSRGRSRERLSGVPGYFYDLMSALRYKYKSDVAFPKIYERLTGKDVLNGKITISELGELLFQENDRSFPMSVTATGTANLGMLALLIERKVLGKKSVIFIDEPEAHLHPAWQVVMAEALFDLAKGGANVVIATHSADILKWLEVHIKKHPDDEKLVALNKFPVNGDATDEKNFSDKIADIKQELTKPFADLYTAGL